MDVRTSVDSDFSEVYGSISLKRCTKKVKQIFDIIQNGGLAAIFDVNTLHNLENVTWVSFKLGSERMYRRGNMHAFHFLFSFKSGDRVAIIFAFLLPVLRGNPTKRSWYRPVVFCSSSHCFTNVYTFPAEI